MMIRSAFQCMCAAEVHRHLPFSAGRALPNHISVRVTPPVAPLNLPLTAFKLRLLEPPKAFDSWAHLRAEAGTVCRSGW